MDSICLKCVNGYHLENLSSENTICCPQGTYGYLDNNLGPICYFDTKLLNCIK